MNNELIDLWLDDIRDPVKHGCAGWVWAKTAAEAIAYLKTGRVRRASLDHDLSIEQTLGQTVEGPSGYTVVCWMEEYNAWPPEGTAVHSMNPIGKAKMKQVIERAYHQ